MNSIFDFIYTNLNEKSYNRTFIYNKRQYVYPYCAFDIETTTTDIGSYMYAFTFALNDGIYVGRTWEEFNELLDMLSLKYNTVGLDRILVVWVHNLSFEFQFLRKRLKFKRIFAKEKRHIITACTVNNIEFRDSLAISGCNLDMTSKLYGCTTKKMLGDLDYKILRNSKTPLTEEERTYMINDVKILREFAEKIYDMYICNGFFPITKTSILRHEVKEKSKQSPSIVDTVKRCFLPQSKYKPFMNFLFSGGITHANPRHANMILNDVHGLDLKSDYPFQMATKYFPNGKARIEPCDDIEYLIELGKSRCLILALEFTNIRLKETSPISPISKSKCVKFEKFHADNGKLWSAKSISIYATELDFEYIRETYEYESVTCKYAESYYKIHLPQYVIQPILQGFIEKEKLTKDTPEYMLAKQKPNSGYGMLVTRMNESEFILDEEGNVELDKDYIFSYEKERRKAFLSPLWGIWVTSHARHTLMRMINKIGQDVVYCDTDSIYLLNYEKHKHLFDEYNKNVSEYNSMYLPTECKKLGTFENEGKCTKFKTLGAKRYIKEKDGEITTTVSGMKKGSFVKYCKKEELEPFDTFDDGLSLSELVSEKTTTRYNDDEHAETIIDAFGNSELMHEYSSVSIIDIPFSMSLEKSYRNLIEKLKQERMENKYENRIY